MCFFKKNIQLFVFCFGIGLTGLIFFSCTLSPVSIEDDKTAPTILKISPEDSIIPIYTDTISIFFDEIMNTKIKLDTVIMIQGTPAPKCSLKWSGDGKRINIIVNEFLKTGQTYKFIWADTNTYDSTKQGYLESELEDLNGNRLAADTLIYVTSTESWEVYPTGEFAHKGYVNSIKKDSYGTIWFSSGNYVFYKRTSDAKFDTLLKTDSTTKAFLKKGINAIAFDSSGIWVATSEGIIFISYSKSAPIYDYDTTYKTVQTTIKVPVDTLQKMKITEHKEKVYLVKPIDTLKVDSTFCARSDTIPPDFCDSTATTQKDSIVYDTTLYFLITYDTLFYDSVITKDSTVSTLGIDKIDSTIVSYFNTQDIPLASRGGYFCDTCAALDKNSLGSVASPFHDVVVTEQGQLWAGTEDGLIECQITRNGSIRQLKILKKYLDGEMVNRILTEGSKNWIGTDRGLHFIEGGIATKKFENKNVLDLIIRGNTIYAGTDQGLVIDSVATSAVTVVSNILKSNVIRTFAVDKNNILWLGGDEGIARQNAMGAWLAYQDERIFKYIFVYDLYIDFTDNRKWLANNNGVSKFSD